MNKSMWIDIAEQAADVAVQNSYRVKPYISKSHYKRMMVGLKTLHWALRFADKG